VVSHLKTILHPVVVGEFLYAHAKNRWLDALLLMPF
jgi:hypothetical protein